MTKDRNSISCAEFQAQLPELIGSGANVAAHPHIQKCELCRALLADLETIAEAARQLFPAVEPRDELWNQIESAIQSEEPAKPNRTPHSAREAFESEPRQLTGKSRKPD